MDSNNLLMHEMVRDMNEAKEDFVGDYSRSYTKQIINEIEKNNLNEFRSWISGPGGIGSYSGGSTELGLPYGWNFHPLDKDFEKIDNNFVITNFNKIVNRLTKYFKMIKFLSIRSPIIKMHHKKLIADMQNMYFDNVSALDKNHILERVEDSKIGNPLGFNKNGKFYTREFLNEIDQILFIENCIEYKDIDSVIEVGSGLGLKADVGLKVNPKLKYYLVEIPPPLYISQKYLIANNYRVLTYDEIKNKNIKNIKDININDYDAVCLAPWMMDILKDAKFDILINEHFFTRLEPKIVQKYLDILLPKIKKAVYLVSSHDKSTFMENKNSKHKGFYGFNCKDYKNILSPSFYLAKERLEIWLGQTNNNTCQLIFNKK